LLLKVLGCTDTCLDDQVRWEKSTRPRSKSLTEYRTAWDRYRLQPMLYHKLIKENFLSIRDTVVETLNGVRRLGPKDEAGTGY
jgi:hypothetical protein